RRVLYRDVRRGGITIRWLSSDGSGNGGVLIGPEAYAFSGVLTPDGRRVVYRTSSAGRTSSDIFVADADSGARPTPLAATPFMEFAPRVSPDGKWMVYASDENGTFEIYLRPLGGSGARIQVSATGGSEPTWSRDGRTVYYRNGRVMMAADLSPGP